MGPGREGKRGLHRATCTSHRSPFIALLHGLVFGVFRLLILNLSGSKWPCAIRRQDWDCTKS